MLNMNIPEAIAFYKKRIKDFGSLYKFSVNYLDLSKPSEAEIILLQNFLLKHKDELEEIRANSVRFNEISEEVAYLIFDLIPRFPNLKKINLNGISINLNGCLFSHLCEKLSESDVPEIDLGAIVDEDIIVNENFVASLSKLSKRESINILDFSYNDLSYSSKNIQSAVFKVIGNLAVNTLKINGMNLFALEDDVINLASDILSSHKYLTSLDLNYNEFDAGRPSNFALIYSIVNQPNKLKLLNLESQNIFFNNAQFKQFSNYQ